MKQFLCLLTGSLVFIACSNDSTQRFKSGGISADTTAAAPITNSVNTSNPNPNGPDTFKKMGFADSTKAIQKQTR